MCHPASEHAKGDVGEALFRGVVNGATTLVRSDAVDGNTVGMKLMDVDVPG